jgi:DNA polymerase-4
VATVDAPLTILHVDMDAFYASVEQRDRPELQGLPVIVGGLGGRGVVCAASYEARPFGVRSAMPIVTAKRLCPHGVYLPLRMKHYAQISRQIQEIMLSFTPLVEPLSLDEAFLDIRGCEGLFGPDVAAARQIKDRIKAETGLTASVGVAPNKFLAKLASDHGKPNGLVTIPAEQVADFLEPLPVNRIWGVGAKVEKRLQALSIHTIGQIRALPERVLADHFGALGRHMWRLSHGQDDRRVVPDREAKSISSETTFDQDIDDLETLRIWLRDLTDHLACRLRQAGLRTRTVELKIRSSDFRTRHRGQTLAHATNATEALWEVAVKVFERGLTREMLPIRLLGVGATRLIRDAAVQGDLFDDGGRQRLESLDQAVDAIRVRFGQGALRRGTRVDEKKGMT